MKNLIVLSLGLILGFSYANAAKPAPTMPRITWTFLSGPSNPSNCNALADYYGYKYYKLVPSEQGPDYGLECFGGN